MCCGCPQSRNDSLPLSFLKSLKFCGAEKTSESRAVLAAGSVCILYGVVLGVFGFSRRVKRESSGKHMKRSLCHVSISYKPKT
ncbi:hypothetical protein PanWU01x14_033590 [Parasponia andersonii]|uniref:Transmembrane protein n=1 Tax=Parasponia andersonii TaxID=3476 RepID=A0A2P5DTQ2_PARAD|nr:hypothetical protein PanWU01x14_033590 [Parasponia andersonii]